MNQETKDAIILNNILRLLRLKDFKQVRLVSKDWNQLAQSLFKNKLCLNTAKYLIMGMDLSVFDRRRHDTGTNVWFGIKLVYPNAQDWNGNNDIPFLTFLDKYTLTFYVRQAILQNKSEVVSAALYASRGSLPNLEELTAYVSSEEKETFFPLLEPNCFPSLKGLVIQSYASIEVGSPDHTFWQSVVNASPNISRLEVPVPFELTRLRNLRKLVVTDRVPDQNEEVYGEMLQAVVYSLKEIKFTSFSGRVGSHFPILPQLLKFQYTFVGKNAFALPDVDAYFPNLKQLHVSYWCNMNEPLEEKGILGFVIRSLDTLKIENLAIKHHKTITNWLLGWEKSVPNLGTLCVALPYTELYDVAMEDWIECVLNNGSWANRLILKFHNNVPLSVVLRNIHLSEFIQREDGRARGVLEIHNCSELHGPNRDREKDLQRFPEIIKKLLRKWVKIRIMYFEVLEPHLGKIFQDVREMNGAVEFFPACRL